MQQPRMFEFQILILNVYIDQTLQKENIYAFVEYCVMHAYNKLNSKGRRNCSFILQSPSHTLATLESDAILVWGLHLDGEI